MKILLICRFFHYIWFIDGENLFCSYIERKNDKVLTFNIVHSPNFEISASLLLVPHFKVSKFNKRRGCLLEEIRKLNFISISLENYFFYGSGKSGCGFGLNSAIQEFLTGIMASKFYSSVAKGLKLKLKFLKINRTFREYKLENLVGGVIYHPHFLHSPRLS